MDLRKLKKLIDLVEESGITELEVTEGEEKVRIVKSAQATPARPKRQTAAAATAPADNDDDYTEGETIKATRVGTFYRAVSPEAEPLIEVGTRVKEGDPIGVIESMMQLNEIEADCDGIVKAILVENGQAVEYGTPLFVIE